MPMLFNVTSSFYTQVEYIIVFVLLDLTCIHTLLCHFLKNMVRIVKNENEDFSYKKQSSNKYTNWETEIKNSDTTKCRQGCRDIG